MASDLIKRDSIRAAVAMYMGSNAYLNDTALDVLKMIDKWLCEAEAVDAVEVVRCKDCKERTQSGGMVLHCSLNGIQVDDDDFCSYGTKG